jgi:hypothetical protein
MDDIKTKNITNDYSTKLRSEHAYNEISSPAEELSMLLNDIKNYLINYPNIIDKKCIKHSKELLMNIELVLNQLDICIDGSAIPLTMTQQLQYSTPMNRLEHLLSMSRKYSYNIVDDILSLGGLIDVSDELNKDINDHNRDTYDSIRSTKLIHHLILEHMEPLQRYSLRKIFDRTMKEEVNKISTKIHSFKWILSWSVIWAIWLISLYVILKWAFTNNSIAIYAWVMTFLIFMFHDIFVYISFDVYMINILTIDTIKNQLNKIENILNEIVNIKMSPLWDGSSDIKSNHMNLLYKFSSTCRASRFTSLSRLASSQLLMRLNDNDIMKLKEIPHSTSPDNGVIYLILLLIPGLFMRLNDFFQEIYLNLTIRITWTLYIYGNYLIYQYASVTILLATYVITGTILSTIYIYIPQAIKRQELRNFSMVKNKNLNLDHSFTSYIDWILLSFTIHRKLFKNYQQNTNEIWKNMNDSTEIDNDKNKNYINKNKDSKICQDCKNLQLSEVSPISIPCDVLNLRLLNWSENWDINNSKSWSNFFWNSDNKQEQYYLGGNFEPMMIKYLNDNNDDNSMSFTKKWLFNFKKYQRNNRSLLAAFHKVLIQFNSFDKEGIGTLDTTDILKLGGYLWSIYNIDKIPLTETEWRYCAVLLQDSVLTKQSQRQSFFEFKQFIEHVVIIEIKNMRLKIKNDVELRSNPPPLVQPSVIPINESIPVKPWNLDINDDNNEFNLSIINRTRTRNINNSSFSPFDMVGPSSIYTNNSTSEYVFSKPSGFYLESLPLQLVSTQPHQVSLSNYLDSNKMNSTLNPVSFNNNKTIISDNENNSSSSSSSNNSFPIYVSSDESSEIETCEYSSGEVEVPVRVIQSPLVSRTIKNQSSLASPIARSIRDKTIKSPSIQRDGQFNGPYIKPKGGFYLNSTSDSPKKK